MRHRWLIGALVTVGMALALALFAPGGQNSLAVVGSTYYVYAEAPGSNTGTSWYDAFLTLQPALDAALSGDQIRVAEGTYKPTAEHGGTGARYRSFQLKNGVALYGGFDPSAGDTEWLDRDWEANPTILSGDIGTAGNASDNSYHVFYHPAGTGLNSTAILDGFTITGGNANGPSAHYYGGGMYNYGSSPALSHCTFEGNSASSGGGMHNIESSAPTLTGCTFADNPAGYGGGMSDYYSSPVLTGCTFSGNSANWGGGMYNNYYSEPDLTDCTFEGNSASYDGAGMYNENHSDATLADCTFSSNPATFDGGGVYNKGSSPTLTDCTFSGNTAGSEGGGMYNDYSSSPALSDCAFEGNSADYGGGMYNGGSAGSPTLANCAFSGNTADHGGGMFNNHALPTLTNCSFDGNSAGGNGGAMLNTNDSSPSLTNCTFWGNSASAFGGGAMHNWSSSPTLINCILWGDSPQEIYNYDLDSAPEVSYSDVQGGCDSMWGNVCGTGNVAGDPWFVDPDNGDFHLGGCSPCIDSGDNLAPDLPGMDFEGDARVVDGDADGTATVDMGVDEVVGGTPCVHLYVPIVLKQY